MKHSITPEEHARVQRRRGRQALGLLVAILVDALSIIANLSWPQEDEETV